MHLFSTVVLCVFDIQQVKKSWNSWGKHFCVESLPFFVAIRKPVSLLCTASFLLFDQQHKNILFKKTLSLLFSLFSYFQAVLLGLSLSSACETRFHSPGNTKFFGVTNKRQKNRTKKPPKQFNMGKRETRNGESCEIRKFTFTTQATRR